MPLTTGRGAGAAALVVWMLAATTAAAQARQTGDVQGRATDSQGLPVPAVDITISSPALGGTRRGVTAGDGTYMFLGLPPGPYEMTFQADRFEPVNRSATVLSGAAIEQNVTLTAVGQNGEATFTGTVPSSLAGASIGTTYRKEEIDVLATPRTLHGIAQLAPAIRRIRGRSPLMEASHSTISS